MSFPRYPEYKDSGVEWLGEVPGNWDVLRLKNLVDVPLKYGANEAAELDDQSLPRFIRITDVAENGTLRDETFKSLPRELAEPFLLKEGDVLLARSGATVGKSLMYQRHWGEACFAGYLIRVRLRMQKCLPQWFNYFCRTDFYWGSVLGSQIQSTIQNVNAEKYANLVLPIPSVGEQEQIVAFLDRETAKIDTLVAEQEKLIALLQEKRQAVISHAVTKGLDPNVPMKDSGVEWLGEVPEHWVVGTLTRFIGPVVDYRGRTPTKVDEGIFLVTARNIRNGRIDYEASEEYVDPDSAASLLARGKPEIDDLLFTMEAPLGQVALIDRTDIALAQRVVKFRGVPSLMKNGYLLYWLMSTGCQNRLETLATGSTALGIKASKLGMIECLAPPLDEQDSIVALIKRETAKLETLMTEAQSAVTLLQERRTALISAAVTGQIDVRGIASLEAV